MEILYKLWISCFALSVWMGSTTVAAPYFPTDDETWESVDTTEAGVDSELLAAAIAFAGATESNALIVLRGGRIVSENYWGDWNRGTRGPSYSAAKSVASVLVGQAIDAGFAQSIDDQASVYLEEWRGVARYEPVLLRHQLSMTTGFRERQFGLLLLQASEDERAYAVAQPIDYEPGTRWWYNDAPYRLLFYVLEEATGQTLPAFSQERLFTPLGMNATQWVVKEGNISGERVENYQWLEFTALDAARFGLMALRKGNWAGEQIVSEEWIQESVLGQYDHAPWYGRLWWLNCSDWHKVPGVDEARVGPLAPDVPPDMFAALGALDQKIYVVPSLDLVVVRLGDAAEGNNLAAGIYDNILLGQICRAFGYQGQVQPMALSLSRDEASLEVSFPAMNGRRYRLETSADLETWSEKPGYSEIFGDGQTIHVSSSVLEDGFLRISYSLALPEL